jgi:hypothetical protein
MAELKHRVVMANGIRIHLVEAGTGPLVLMVQAFPNLGTRRRQLHCQAGDGISLMLSPMQATERWQSMCAVTVARRHQQELTSTG